MKKLGPFSNVDEYIALFPPAIRKGLLLMRKTILKAAPDAIEGISYQMPAYTLHGKVVFFAAMNEHYGFYPTSSGITAFKEELKDYDTSKGTIRFPLNKPLPVKLIRDIVLFRVLENREKADAQQKPKKK